MLLLGKVGSIGRGNLKVNCRDVVVAHLAGGVKKAVAIVGIVKGLLVVKENIHRKCLSLLLSSCLNAVTLDRLDKNIHHLFADIVDVGKVLKNTAF